jgi:hypothetical protein
MTYALTVFGIVTSLAIQPWPLNRVNAAIVVMAAWGLVLFRDICRYRFRPVLVLDRAGLMIRNRGRGLEKVPWADVAAVETVQEGTRKYTRVTLASRPVSLDLSDMLGHNVLAHRQFMRISNAYRMAARLSRS